MRFTLDWLKDHLQTDASIEEICDCLTHIGLEVEKTENLAAGLEAFTIAEIKQAAPHPNADRLKLCQVDTGEETLQIVCGAANARTGLKVVLAKIGSTIPTSGLKIKPTKIRDVESNGMLCSPAELGISNDKDGIIELQDDAVIGKSFVEHAGLNDIAIEIAITPNRGDCLGIHGIARELAAAGLGTLKPLNIKEIEGKGESPVAVTIDDPACSYFIGCYIKDVENKQSPDWLQQRLKAVGQQPISALVDITNYISISYARPLHLYDVEKLAGNLQVRSSKEGETIQALNDKSYRLKDNMLVIADSEKIQAIAGIIGSSESGVSSQTSEIFLEVALFDPISVTKTGRRLDIITDSRHRFERHVDPHFVQQGAYAALEMIQELCGGTASKLITAGQLPNATEKLSFRVEKIAKLGGMQVSEDKIQEILTTLGFTITKQAENWQLTVPSWRNDISEEADIVEEILRIHGYENLPCTPLPIVEQTIALNSQQTQQHRSKRELAKRGLTELITWSFMNQQKAALFTEIKKEMLISNPISSDLDTLRPTIFANLLDAVSQNAARDKTNLAFFEIGPIFTDNVPGSQRLIACAIRSDQNEPKNIYGKHRSVDLFDAKADALAALKAAGAPINNLRITTDTPSWYHPGRSGALLLGKSILAFFGELHPALLQKIDCSNLVVGCEVFFDQLPPTKKKSTTKQQLESSIYQAVSRDFAFLLDQNTSADDLLRSIKRVDKSLITEISLFDVYQGDNIADGKKSLAVNVVLQPSDRTLTEAEIEALSQKIIQSVQEQTGGTLRQ